MKNTTKLISALSVVAGLGVAMLPLGSYAVSPATSTTKLKFTVNETLSIASDANGNITHTISGKDESKTEKITVTANKGGYDLTVKGKGADADMINEEDSNSKIEALASDGELTEGHWGLKVNGVGQYKAIKGNSNPVTIASKSVPSLNDETNIQYGVYPAANQKAGTYAVELIYTATAK